MARMIDKDKALFDAFHLGKIEDMFMVSAQDVCDMIRKQEEIDAVPVVRCKDCIHNDDCMNDFCGYGRKDSDFCPYGERKEGDSDAVD